MNGNVLTVTLIYSCLAIRAVAIYCCPGYSTKDFFATHGKFTATYGEPSKCYADHGTQLIAGAKELDWSKVTCQGRAKRTEWVFTAKGSSQQPMGSQESAMQITGPNSLMEQKN